MDIFYISDTQVILNPMTATTAVDLIADRGKLCRPITACLRAKGFVVVPKKTMHSHEIDWEID